MNVAFAQIFRPAGTGGSVLRAEFEDALSGRRIGEKKLSAALVIGRTDAGSAVSSSAFSPSAPKAVSAAAKTSRFSLDKSLRARARTSTCTARPSPKATRRRTAHTSGLREPAPPAAKAISAGTGSV